MFHYFNALTDVAGNALPGFYARVVDQTTNQTVALASDANGTPIETVSGSPNTAKSDELGNLSLYVAEGTYFLDIYSPDGITLVKRIKDVPMTGGPPGTDGDPGPPGPPGAGAVAVGLFTDGGTTSIPTGTNAVRTSGWGATGVGAAYYIYDAAVDASYVTANPYSSFRSSEGRGFRLAEVAPSSAQYGATGNNLSTDGPKLKAWAAGAIAGKRQVLEQGPVGGANKFSSDGLTLVTQVDVDAEQGATIRSDQTTGQRINAVTINPVNTIAGGASVLYTASISGTVMTVTANASNANLFVGDHVSGPGVLAGTTIGPGAGDGVKTGTFNLLVNGVAQSQTVASSSNFRTYRGDVRGMRWFGGTVFTNNISTPGDLGAGGSGLAFGTDPDNNVKAMIGTTIAFGNRSGGLAGITIQGGLGREHLWTSIFRETVSNVVVVKGSDGIQAHQCVVGGTRVGYNWDLLEGAYCDGVVYGTVVCRDGAVDVLSGSFMKFHHVQMEQAAGASQQQFKSMVTFRGLNYPCVANEIIGCNFGGGTNYEVHITLANARNTRIYGNQFALTFDVTGTTVKYDLFFLHDTTDDAVAAPTYLAPFNYNTAAKGRKDPYDTIIGYDLVFRGSRTRQPTSEYTDVSRLMTVNRDRPLRQIHRGIWYPMADIITNLASGFSIDATAGFQVMMEHSGQVVFAGGLTFSAGALTKDKDLFSIPLHFMPFRAARVMAVATLPYSNANPDTIVSLIVNQANGYLTTRIASTTSTGLSFDNTHWKAVTNPYSPVGP